MSGASTMATRRLRKELLALQADPLPDVVALPEEADILTWWYAMKGVVGTPYEGGMYIGKLRFPKNYPLGPPSVFMLTPSGRFQCNVRLCLSMSDFHPEEWNPAWNVGTILSGILSFMNSEEVTTGALQASHSHRVSLAAESRAYNTKHFSHLFGGDLDGFWEQAEKARKQAEEKRRKGIKYASTSKTKATNATPTTPVANDNTTTASPPSDTTTSTAATELTEKEKERRRLKNAKKKAKQKAKKQELKQARGAEDL